MFVGLGVGAGVAPQQDVLHVRSPRGEGVLHVRVVREKTQERGDLDEGIPTVEVRDGVAFPWDPSESFGAACSQPSLLANVSALLAAWRPGAEGGPALFSLLSGEVNPSAKLSVAWPRSVGGIGSQVPYLQQFALHYRGASILLLFVTTLPGNY